MTVRHLVIWILPLRFKHSPYEILHFVYPETFQMISSI